jgi:sugar O-acyltransferase (sialic acid O-acetyltransferase NeuD family)
LKKIVIIGAKRRGSSNVILDTIEAIGNYEVISFFDDDKKLQGEFIRGVPINGTINNLSKYKSKEFENKDLYFTFALSNSHIKESLDQKIYKWGLKPCNLIHPSCVISNNVEFGKSLWFAPGVIVNSGSKIGNGAVLNTATTIDHDCKIEDYVNISPGCHLSGRTRIKKHTFLGTGVITIPDITIGKNCVVGAGSVIINDINDNSKVVGVPGRIISDK